MRALHLTGMFRAWWRQSAWLFVLLVQLLGPSRSVAQSSFEKEQAFRTAVEAGQLAQAQTLLPELLRSDSIGIYRLVDLVEALFLPGEMRGDTPPNASEMAQLLRIYGLGQRHDPAGPAAWKTRTALLGLRYPAAFPGRIRPWLEAAILADPHGCPLMLYTRWLEADIAAYEAGQLPLEALARDWAQASQRLYSREIRRSADATATARTTQHLALQLRATIPDCKKLAQTYGQEIRQGSLTATACADFLALYVLQDCYEASQVWQSAFDRALEGAPTPWLYRLAAADALNGKDYQQSLAHWRTAAALEKDAVLRAADLLHQAQVQATLGEFRSARATIEWATRLHPNWGEPYLQLADLYLQGADQCAFSDFDQKALYWLLSDLCHTAKNVDAGALQAANLRIYAYRRRMPSREEIAFKGLQAGDTWPLKCWMSTVTTVKIP